MRSLSTGHSIKKPLIDEDRISKKSEKYSALIRELNGIKDIFLLEMFFEKNIILLKQDQKFIFGHYKNSIQNAKYLVERLSNEIHLTEEERLTLRTSIIDYRKQAQQYIFDLKVKFLNNLKEWYEIALKKENRLPDINPGDFAIQEQKILAAKRKESYQEYKKNQKNIENITQKEFFYQRKPDRIQKKFIPEKVKFGDNGYNIETSPLNIQTKISTMESLPEENKIDSKVKVSEENTFNRIDKVTNLKYQFPLTQKNRRVASNFFVREYGYQSEDPELQKILANYYVKKKDDYRRALKGKQPSKDWVSKSFNLE